MIIVCVGLYYMLENTFGFAVRELDWDRIWPLAVIALGLALVWGAYHRSHRGAPSP